MMITVPAREENVAIELRDFKIQSGQMAAFIEAWRTGVVPLRKSHGFRIAGAWTVAGEDRFVWILEAEGTRAEFEARDAQYYESRNAWASFRTRGSGSKHTPRSSSTPSRPIEPRTERSTPGRPGEVAAAHDEQPTRSDR
jgi:hypothetical protein